MRKISLSIILLLGGMALALMLPINHGHTRAQQGPPTQTPITPTASNTPITLLTVQPTGRPPALLVAQAFSLASLGARDLELVTPASTGRFTFNVPDNWLAVGNNTLMLTIDYTLTNLNPIGMTSDGSTATPLAIPPVVVRVRLDGVPIANIRLLPTQIGRQTVTVNLPVEIMGSPTNRNHFVQFAIEGREQCLIDVESRVRIVAAESLMRFEYRPLPPVLDLVQYPRPFYNNSLANQAEQVLFVLPQAPTELDYEVAASAAAGLGQLSRNRVHIRAVNADQLTAEDKLLNQLWIGQIGSHRLIDAAYAANQFPTRLEGQQLIVGSTQITPQDGVAQIILNPDNASTAIISITGQTPDALRKAVQVLTGPPSLLGVGGPVALVSQIRPTSRPDPGAVLPERVTFRDLGFENVPIYGAGVQYGEITFTMPDGIELTDAAMLEMFFDYSQTLRESQSSVTLFMNDTPINSVYLGERGALREPITSIRANIPPSSVLPGALNTLLIQVDSSGATGETICDIPPASIIWLSPRPESYMFLPRQPADAAAQVPLLSGFPTPFNRRADLGDVWFVLPDAPTATDVTHMLGLIARLGSAITAGQRFSPQVSLGNVPDTADLGQYHFIALGRPTQNRFISRWNMLGALPQPFEPDTDVLRQVIDDVTYRLPPGFDIGVIQLLEMPEQPNRALLLITSTGPVGQDAAINLLLRGRTSNLVGDVVYVTPTQVWTVNTRTRETLAVAATATTELPSALNTPSAGGPTATPIPVVTVTPTATPTATPTGVGW